MDNLQQSLLEDLKQKGIIKEDELKRADLYLQFSDGASFSKLPQAAIWIIDNKIVSEQRSKEIIALLEQEYPNVRQSITTPAKTKKSTQSDLPSNKENTSVKSYIQKQKPIVEKANSSTAAFEHNNKLLFQCYNDGIINFEQYKQGHKLLNQLKTIFLPHKEAMLAWLHEKNISQPLQAKVINQTHNKKTQSGRGIKHNLRYVFLAFLLLIAFLLLVPLNELNPNSKNICDTSNNKKTIASNFKEPVSITEPTLILTNKDTDIHTCSVIVKEQKKTFRVIFQFNNRLINRKFNEVLRYERLSTEPMNKSERAFTEAIRRIDNSMITLSAKGKNKPFAVFEKSFINIKSDLLACKKTGQNTHSCPLTLSYQNKFQTNSPLLEFTESFDFIQNNNNSWAISSTDNDALKKLNNALDKAARNKKYSRSNIIYKNA